MAAKNTPKTTSASAAPGTKDAKAAKVKVEKVSYPGLLGPNDTEGKPTSLLLKEWPADHNPKLHKPLVRKNFENEVPWLINRAEHCESQAATFRKEAEMVGKLGSKSDRQKAKKLIAMRDRMAELRKQLEAEGIDVDALTAD